MSISRWRVTHSAFVKDTPLLSSRITQSAFSMLQIRIWATNISDILSFSIRFPRKHVWSTVVQGGRVTLFTCASHARVHSGAWLFNTSYELITAMGRYKNGNDGIPLLKIALRAVINASPKQQKRDECDNGFHGFSGASQPSPAVTSL